VTGGRVEGVVADGVASFKGIPFAAPPVGALRWRAPQAVVAWAGVRKADAFGPSPMQDAFWPLLMGSPARLSEDCLYLNVWTPARQRGEKLPVMVWIYGGGFVSGMTSAGMYDGAQLARQGVVLVSVAYRVGPFGFLAHPELSRESGQGSGCYGLLDQIAGLKWVQQNIAEFGGDPSCVTVFGESAGGISVAMLTAVPAAKGLFQRAISQSGGSMAPIRSGTEAGRMIPSLPLAEETGRSFLAKLGARDLKAARALSAEAIQKGGVQMGQFWPVADGVVLLGDQYELYEAGQFHDTPILVGSNSDEGALFVHQRATPARLEEEVRSRFGSAAEALLAAYPHATDDEATESLRDLLRDSVFAWPTWAWARLHARREEHETFVYYFDRRTPGSKGGASHAAEIGYVFGNLGGWGGGRRDEDRQLSQLMSHYWVNFARTGDPNGEGLPPWKPFTEQKQDAMVFDDNPTTRSLPNLEQLRAFDAFYAGERKRSGEERQADSGR